MPMQKRVHRNCVRIKSDVTKSKVKSRKDQQNKSDVGKRISEIERRKQQEVASGVFVWKTEKGRGEVEKEKTVVETTQYVTDETSSWVENHQRERLEKKKSSQRSNIGDETARRKDISEECFEASDTEVDLLCRVSKLGELKKCFEVEFTTRDTHYDAQCEDGSKRVKRSECNSPVRPERAAVNSIDSDELISNSTSGDSVFWSSNGKAKIEEKRSGHYGLTRKRFLIRAPADYGRSSKGIQVGKDFLEKASGCEKVKKTPELKIQRSEVGMISEDLEGVSKLRGELDKLREENKDLRLQIDRLSSFVESSENLRERSELLLVRQKKELEKEVGEKENLKNKVCCLEELRRKLQCAVEDQIEKNEALKVSMKTTEARLLEEKEKLKYIKKECSFEVSKNAELELVLQTVLEELGSANKLLEVKCDNSFQDDQVMVENRVEAWSWRNAFRGAMKSRVGDKGIGLEIWNREKRQFEGKIKLLEMDKEKLNSQIESLKVRIVEHERVGCNLRENNEVLEFRIAELEYQLINNKEIPLQ